MHDQNDPSYRISDTFRVREERRARYEDISPLQAGLYAVLDLQPEESDIPHLTVVRQDCEESE